MIKVESHRIPRGMTRMTNISGWNFPVVWLPIVLGFPCVLAFAQKNVFWMALILPCAMLARRLADDTDNNPRLMWLAIISGSKFARRLQGVEVVHPLLPTDDAMGVLHD